MPIWMKPAECRVHLRQDAAGLQVLPVQPLLFELVWSILHEEQGAQVAASSSHCVWPRRERLSHLELTRIHFDSIGDAVISRSPHPSALLHRDGDRFVRCIRYYRVDADRSRACV